MGILNKRNAVLGWGVWQIGKRVAKKKAKDAIPGRVDDSKRPNKGAMVSALAAVGGALWFWRKRRGDDDESS
jgi:hypothetical protein